MVKLHIISAACFFIAFILYLFGTEYSVAFGLLGIIFEVVAWVLLFDASKRNNES